MTQRVQVRLRLSRAHIFRPNLMMNRLEIIVPKLDERGVEYEKSGDRELFTSRLKGLKVGREHTYMICCSVTRRTFRLTCS